MGQETEVRSQETVEGPVAGDFESLKQSAKDRIAKGDLAGINPHKVLRLCAEFAELRQKCEMSDRTRQRVITTLSWMVADTKHRFDDCRNNLENGSEGGYSPELTEAIELLEDLKNGVSGHDRDTLLAAYQKGFEDAKIQIMEKIRLLVK